MFRYAAIGPLLAVLFFSPVWGDEGDGDSGTVVGWGTQGYNGPGDLGKAVELSQQKARLDLSANILTYVKVNTIDETVQENGQTKEYFESMTVTKVVQLLREVNLSRPQVDSATHLVTTKAWVSKTTAREIIKDALVKLKAKEEEYQQNMARLRTLTDGGKFYYKKKVEKVQDMSDLNHMTDEMEKLKEDLIHEKLRDIQDVRNAITTRFLKHFPTETEVTYLAYIGMDQYKAIIDNYDKEVYGQVSPDYIGGAYDKEADPWNMPNVAESVLPAKVYSNIGWGFRYAYFTGIDPEMDIALWGRYSYARDFWGLSASLGFGFGFGDNNISKNDNIYADQGYTTPYNLHFPLELDGYLYLHDVKSGGHIPFVKLGLLGNLSLLTVQIPGTGDNKDLASGFSGGFVFGVGATIFHKSGMFLQTLDFGLDFQWLPNGFYNEGDQLGIGAFCNWGII